MRDDVKRRGLFLDRDGVLNSLITTEGGKSRPPWNLNELHILPEVVSVLSDPRIDQWIQVVVTNQPDVARGDLALATLEKINAQLLDLIPTVQGVFVCHHDNNDRCQCRKPRVGLLISASIKFGLDLADSFMVGDRWVDIAAGKEAGTKTILLRSIDSWLPNSAGDPPDDLQPDFIIESMSELIGVIHPRN